MGPKIASLGCPWAQMVPGSEVVNMDQTLSHGHVPELNL